MQYLFFSQWYCKTWLHKKFDKILKIKSTISNLIKFSNCIEELYIQNDTPIIKFKKSLVIATRQHQVSICEKGSYIQKSFVSFNNPDIDVCQFIYGDMNKSHVITPQIVIACVNEALNEIEEFYGDLPEHAPRRIQSVIQNYKPINIAFGNIDSEYKLKEPLLIPTTIIPTTIIPKV